ncbi:chitobiase/beta-hexosaminidase C-terminal domain-containing protein [Candidatus Margulisiibacteriota bacterium]
MRSWVNKLMIVALMLLISTTAGATVDVLFSPQTDSVERNAFHTISIVASANVLTPISGVDANYSYDPAIFTNASLHSNITGWPTSFEVVNEATGYVTYQKSNGGQPYYFNVGAGSSEIIYYVTYKVAPNAVLGATVFNFDTQGLLNIMDGTTNVRGAYNSSTVTILPDTTPPQTTASHASDIYNTILNVTLGVHPSDQSGDLNRIHYTIDGNTPNIHSPIYSGPISIPANTTTVLRFFGIDNYNNEETPNIRTYTVDTIDPVISNLVISPNFANAGKTITISFEVNEPLVGGVPSSVKIGNILATPYDLSYPTYGYYYDVSGGEVEGTNNVNISVTDLAVNNTTDTSEQVAFDFTPPSYRNAVISALSPVATFIRFTASEELNTLNTILVVASGNYGVFKEKNGLEYIYQYTITGAEISRLVEVHGYDLAGNDSWNTEGWDILNVAGEDLYRNPGQKSVTIDIRYDP